MRYAMIMAGGAGTRLWPMSRKARPKQLLPFISDPEHGSDKSLLEIAAERVAGLVDPERQYICTAEAFRAQIRGSLPRFADGQILGEPAARDTVNAVGFAAAVFHKLDPDAVFVVLTADHLIHPEDTFRGLVDLAFRLVEEEPSRLVTFSIKPTFASTGFGYVQRGSPIGLKDDDHDGTPLAYEVHRFVEKPDAPRAQAYLDSGDFGWNSGMFVFSAKTFLSCLERFKPESHEGLTKIADAWGTDNQKAVLEEVYPNLPKISVDYAVMEPASTSDPDPKHPVSVCTVLADVGWLDVGSWPAYADTLTADDFGNRATGVTLHALDAGNNVVVSEPADTRHTVALLGVEDLIVVHTPDATLVMHKDKAQDIKKVHEQLDDTLK